MKTGRALKVAFKALGRNKLRTFLMMIGIVIGIAALTIIVSAGLGARKKVMERVRKFGLDCVMIWAGGPEAVPPNAGAPATTLKLEDAKALKQNIRSVADVAPIHRQAQVDVKYQDKSATTMIFACTRAFGPSMDLEVVQGDFITDSDVTDLARVGVIAPTVRKELFGSTNPIGEQVRIGNVSFEIKGIMKAKGVSPHGGDMDDRIYIPLSTYMRRLANVDYIGAIRVQFKSPDNIKAAIPEMTSLLRERHQLAAGLPDDFSIVTPAEITKVAQKALGAFNILLVLIAGIALISGGVVVANIMLISVTERRKEIGLRKAVGARSRDIMTQFLLEATFVTLAGGIAGVVIGIAGAQLLGAMTKMPVAVSWESIVLGLVFSTLVGVVAGLQPARRASRLQPIEALRS
jgi:putative ABC transport system permease protein